jgi:octopine/nopaline transport system substrate-binding protein
MIVGPRLSGGPFGEGIGAAVRRGDHGLAKIFSNAIKKRISDGSIRALSIKWFGFDLSARP